MKNNDANAKRRKKRIFIGFLAVIVTAVVLTFSTYAWFTANRTVTVSDVNVNVAAANGLQISVDGLKWTTVISNDDIIGASTTYAGATNQLPTGANTLSPVSTIGEINSANGFMKMFSGSIEGSSVDGSLILTTNESTETNGTTGDFVAFDVFFQVNTATPIYLTSNSKVAVTNGQTSTGIENAARVAFINEGNVASGSSANDIQALKAGGTPIIWEPNNDAHTSAAISNAANNYGITTTDGGAPVTYYGVKTAIPSSLNIPLSTQDSAYVSLVTPGISTTKAGISSDAYESLLTLSPGITKVRIYMWIEGQDVDCEDNASGGAVTYSLQFSSNTSAS